MALSKASSIDKITIRSPYNCIELRTATIVMEDDEVIAMNYKSEKIWPGSIDENDNHVDLDISGYSAEIQGVCNAVWTEDVKTKYKEYLISKK